MDVVGERSDYGKIKKARPIDVVVGSDYGKIKKYQFEETDPLRKYPQGAFLDFCQSMFWHC